MSAIPPLSKGEELVKYCQCNDLDRVQTLLAEGADPNYSVSRGFPVLFVAARDGFADVVRVLLAGGADANGAAEGGKTALMAAVTGSITKKAHGTHDKVGDVVAALIGAGANVNATTRYGETALTMAAAGFPDAISPLLEAGADINHVAGTGWTALARASRAGQSAIVRHLLAAGADIEAGHNGDTALAAAVKGGKAGVVALLLANGANVNAASLADGPILNVALHTNLPASTAIAVRLVSEGADVNAAECLGFTPSLHLCVSRFVHRGRETGAVELVRVMVAGGCNIDSCSSTGVSAVSVAAKEKNLVALRELLRYGADVDTSPTTDTMLGFQALHRLRTPLQHAHVEWSDSHHAPARLLAEYSVEPEDGWANVLL